MRDKDVQGGGVGVITSPKRNKKASASLMGVMLKNPE